MTWTKSSVQHAREMESLVKAKGYSTPSLTQDQPEDVSVGKKSSARNEQPKREQYIDIGKSAVPQSLLTANAKKQQAKTGMLDTKEEGGVLDALGTTYTEGRKATDEAITKAAEAFARDPRIYGTTAPAVAMPALIATTVLGGTEVLGAGAAGARRAAPHLSKGIDKLGRAAKRSKDFVKNAERKADINISTSKAGTKHNLDLEKVPDGASSLFDELPPSTSDIAATIAAAKKAKEQADDLYKRHNLKWGKQINNANSTGRKK